jgi:hypothetical protein
MTASITIHPNPHDKRVNGISRELAQSGHLIRIHLSRKIPRWYPEVFGDDWREFSFKTPEQREQFIDAVYALHDEIVSK